VQRLLIHSEELVDIRWMISANRFIKALCHLLGELTNKYKRVLVASLEEPLMTTVLHNCEHDAAKVVVVKKLR
jgi:hypothetical protein